MKIGFVGLGRMGTPMARNLLKAGHEVTVWNRTRTSCDALAAEGATVAGTPREAARTSQVLITMVADDAALDDVMFSSNGACCDLPTGAVHVGMSTISLNLAHRLTLTHALSETHYVSAPVYGRPEVAAAGKLWIVAAGPQEALARCRPLFEVLGRGITVVGEDPRAANAVKLAGNFLLAAAIEGMAEAIALTRKAGVDTAAFLEVVADQLFASPIYGNYGRTIAQERYTPAGFALRLGLKDMRLATAAGGELGVPLPLASLLRDRFLAAANRGLADADWAALARLAAEDAGLPGGGGVPAG